MGNILKLPKRYNPSATKDTAKVVSGERGCSLHFYLI